MWRSGRTDTGAQLTVQDNGVGISQEDLDRIWQRFYQADPSRQESAGLGLGLSMVQQIVALHGGHGCRRKRERPRHDVHGHAAGTPRKRGEVI